MLAGWHHQLRSEPYSLQIQTCHCNPCSTKMGTQRLDLPRGFSKRDTPRVPLSLDRLNEPKTSNPFSFRPNPTITPTPSPSSLVVQNPAPWERNRVLKRYHEEGSSFDDYPCLVRAKRTRIGDCIELVGGVVEGGDEVWFPHSIEGHTNVQAGGDGREEREEGEEKVYLVPNAANFPLIGSSSYSLARSFETEGASSKSKSDSSSSSETDTENGNNGKVVRAQGEENPADRFGLELVGLLVECIESVRTGNHEAMNCYFARLGEEASPVSSVIHRVVAYFTESLVLRAAKLWPQFYEISPPRELTDRSEEDEATALRLFNTVSPIPKFLHFTMNERLLRAFEGKDRVHIIDFDVKQGLQWPSLLESLAARRNPPSHVRITGVGESKQELQETGVRLARLAESKGLQFEFHPVVDRLEDVRLWMLHVKRDECVAVNCLLVLHKLLYDESGGSALADFLSLVKSTNPSIVLMAEQEADHNGGRWERRVANSVSYYSAIFDSLDSCLGKESSVRVKIEEMYAREIRNLVACEGSERIERHERFEQWSRLMADRGFRNAGIGEREMSQSRLILRICPNWGRFGLERKGDDGNGGLCLKWSDQSLYTVSAWELPELGRSSPNTTSPAR